MNTSWTLFTPRKDYGKISSLVFHALHCEHSVFNPLFIVLSTFGLFTNGFTEFDKAYEEGLIYRVLTTNLIYQSPALLDKEYYISVPMEEYIAVLIDNLNCDNSISDLINPATKIKEYLSEEKVEA